MEGEKQQQSGWAQGWWERSLTRLISAQVGHFSGGLGLRLTWDPAEEGISVYVHEGNAQAMGNVNC